MHSAAHSLRRRPTRLTIAATDAILPSSYLQQAAVPKILIADDNPVTLRFFAEAMAQLGFACDLARDGAEAVTQAQRSRFDLLLFDARMPDLDGAEALARIRGESGPSRQTPAVATTASVDETTHRELIGSGFVDVIAKPVSIDVLRVLLARHLGSSSEKTPTRSAGAAVDLDDASALAAVGGDRSILAALRGLLVAELDALPAELDVFAADADTAALRDRLHRLDASAGFCGAPALARASETLRAALNAENVWPKAAVADFIAACAAVRTKLLASESPTA